MITAVLLALPMAAQAVPSQDDIDFAKTAEEAARMSVAQIEVELSRVTAQADEADQAAQGAAEELNAAQEKLDAATTTAAQAKDESDTAQENYRKGAQELASVAQTAYRAGGSALDPLAPYLESDGLRTVEAKQSSIDTFSSSANVKMQKVSALEQVAGIMKEAADKAADAQQKATDEVRTRTEAAQAAAESANALQAQTEATRTVLVQELAKREGTTVALVNERRAYEEQQREAAQRAAREQEAAAQAQRDQEAAAQAASQAAASRDQARPAQTTAPAPAQTSAPAPAPTRTSAPAPTPTKTSTPTPVTPAPAPNGSAVEGAIAFASSKVGGPYVWGGNGPVGYDCSGLVLAAYASQGVTLGGRTTTAQYYGGRKVPLAQRQRGDLIFWYSASQGIYHVAMLTGRDTMVEAANPRVGIRFSAVHTWGNVMSYVVRPA